MVPIRALSPWSTSWPWCWSSRGLSRSTEDPCSFFFNSAESFQPLNTQLGLMSSIIIEHNVAVNQPRVVWLGAMTGAAAGPIYIVPGEGKQYDTVMFLKLSGMDLHLGKVWFMSDLLQVCQDDSLCRAGYDYLRVR